MPLSPLSKVRMGALTIDVMNYERMLTSDSVHRDARAHRTQTDKAHLHSKNPILVNVTGGNRISVC